MTSFYQKQKESFQKEVERQIISTQKREQNELRNKFLALVGKTINNGLTDKPLTSNAEISVITEREWRKFVGMYNAVPEFDPLSIVSKDQIRKTILAGVPHSLRGEIWCMLCKVKREQALHAEGIYFKLLDIENPEEEHRITKDVDRTFTNYPVSGQAEDNDASWNNDLG